MDPLPQSMDDTDEDSLLTPTQTPPPAASLLKEQTADMASFGTTPTEMDPDKTTIENDGTSSAFTAIHQGMQGPFPFLTGCLSSSQDSVANQLFHADEASPQATKEKTNRKTRSRRRKKKAHPEETETGLQGKIAYAFTKESF